jgi:hypothetical protein
MTIYIEAGKIGTLVSGMHMRVSGMHMQAGLAEMLP